MTLFSKLINLVPHLSYRLKQLVHLKRRYISTRRYAITQMRLVHVLIYISNVKIQYFSVDPLVMSCV